MWKGLNWFWAKSSDAERTDEFGIVQEIGLTLKM